jgi:transcriptional regulator with XRE-family HTH domain
MSLGERIAAQRKQLGLTQKSLAESIQKSDGQAITPQYLNDIEHDRRSPASPELIEQLARALELQPDILYYEVGVLPSDLTNRSVSNDRVVAAFQAFRDELEDRG